MNLHRIPSGQSQSAPATFQLHMPASTNRLEKSSTAFFSRAVARAPLEPPEINGRPACEKYAPLASSCCSAIFSPQYSTSRAWPPPARAIFHSRPFLFFPLRKEGGRRGREELGWTTHALGMYAYELSIRPGDASVSLPWRRELVIRLASGSWWVMMVGLGIFL